MFNICTDSKESRCPSTCGEQGGQGQHAARQTGQHCPGPLQNFAVMEQKPTLHMHAAGWDVERADTAGRLQSGSRARRGEAGSSYTAQSKNPWTGLRQKVSVGRNERTKQAVCAHTSSATTFSAMTNVHKTIPGQHGASDTLRYGGWELGCGEEAGLVSWLCTRWHKRCTCSSSWKVASLGL